MYGMHWKSVQQIIEKLTFKQFLKIADIAKHISDYILVPLHITVFTLLVSATVAKYRYTLCPKKRPPFYFWNNSVKC